MILSLLTQLLVLICEGLVILFVLVVYNCNLFLVDTKSMEPLLSQNDMVISVNYKVKLPIIQYFFDISKFIGNTVKLKHGDTIIIKGQNNQKEIKRIIGLPGDHITIKDNKIYINDTCLMQQSVDGGFLYKETNIDGCTTYYIIESEYQYDELQYLVPDNMVFCIGDNRALSLDSRTIGSYSQNQILSIPIFKFLNNYLISSYRLFSVVQNFIEYLN